MSKKKLTKFEEEMVHQWEESMKPLTEEQVREFAESFTTDSNGTLIEFPSNVQFFPNEKYHFTDGIALIHRKGADNPVWLHSSSENPLDAYASIGNDSKLFHDDKLRAVWEFGGRRRESYHFSEKDPYHFSELEIFYSAIMVNGFLERHPEIINYDEAFEDVSDRILITCFTNGELSTVIVKEPRDVDAVKAFISEIVATGATINDGFSLPGGNDSKDNIPGIEAFKALISKLTEEDEAGNAPTIDSEGDNSTTIVEDNDASPPLISEDDEAAIVDDAKE